MEHIYAMLLLSTARPSAEQALLAYRTRDYSSEPVANAGEEADPRFWTAYDFYVVEREARAGRRAHLFRTAVASLKRLYQRLRHNIPAAGTLAAQRG